MVLGIIYDCVKILSVDSCVDTILFYSRNSFGLLSTQLKRLMGRVTKLTITFT